LGAEVSGYFRPFYAYFQADGGADLDIFYVCGDNVQEIVKNFAELVGKPCMPPLYSLGYQGSTMYYTELPKDCDKAVQVCRISCTLTL
jgi:alpha-glucosidase